MNDIFVIKEDGRVIVHDPSTQMIPFFLAIDPNYRIESQPPEATFTPKYKILKEKRICIEGPIFDQYPEHLLVSIYQDDRNTSKGTEYSGLDVLYAAALMSLKKCSLCAWNCGVNRFSNEIGHCGQGGATLITRLFKHIAEESVINPAIVTNIGNGCALNCKFCIAHQMLRDLAKFIPLDPETYWTRINELMQDSSLHNNTIEFTNPTEAPHSIIRILLAGPNDDRSPVIVNAHLYGTLQFYQLMVPVADAWIVSFPFGNNNCAKLLSGIERYVEQASFGIDYLAKNDCRIIVRILVLPGHTFCCHEPVIKLLSKYRDQLWVSVLDQYVPEHEAHLDPILSKRPTKDELERVEKLVEENGLRNIANAGREFWKNG